MEDWSKFIPLHLYILTHLKRAGMDYAKSISKIADISIDVIENALNEMERKGIIERTHGSAIKRTEARFKLSYEVRKHHKYYRLTNDSVNKVGVTTQRQPVNPVPLYLLAEGEEE